MRRYCLSHRHGGSIHRFCISLLALTSLAKETASKLTSFGAVIELAYEDVVSQAPQFLDYIINAR